MSHTRFLERQDCISISIDDDGCLTLIQSSPTMEDSYISVSNLYIDEFLNQLKLTIAGE